MTEAEAMEWIDGMRRCVKADTTLPANVASHLNEIHRFLIEFCCPQTVAGARVELNRALIDQRC